MILEVLGSDHFIIDCSLLSTYEQCHSTHSTVIRVLT